MLGVLRIVLGPMLVWQGLRVRRDILRMPEAAGPRSGQTGQGETLRLLILGDSSAAGVGADHQSQAISGQLIPRLAARYNVDWRLLAKTGWETADALTALDQLGTETFDVAVISVGINDVTAETGLSHWLGTYEKLLDQLRNDFGVQTIIVCSLPPIARFPALPEPLRWYLGLQGRAHDRALAEMANARAGVAYLALDFGDMNPSDMAEDGFHPRPGVYASWAAQIDAALTGTL